MYDLAELQKQILAFKRHARTRRGAVGVERLATSPIALPAWRTLSEKVIGEEALMELAVALVDEVVLWGGNIGPPFMHTAAEIKRAGHQASRLALSLAELIRDYSSLRIPLDELQSPAERAARDRIERGLAFSGHMFAVDVEHKLDELQARDYPQFASLMGGDNHLGRWNDNHDGRW